MAYNIKSKEQLQEILNQYGTNKSGKVPLCASCAYIGGYCLKPLRYYRCRDYIMDAEIKTFLEANK